MILMSSQKLTWDNNVLKQSDFYAKIEKIIGQLALKFLQSLNRKNWIPL